MRARRRPRTLRRWPRLRTRFLVDKGWGRRDATAAEFAARDAMLAAAARYDRVILWFEHDLYDQLPCCSCWHSLRKATAVARGSSCCASVPTPAFPISTALAQSVMTCAGDLPSMFRACAEQEEARYLGDTVFFDYTLKLALPRDPTMRFLDGGPPPDKPSLTWQRPLALTPFGRRLLTGTGDLSQAVGINRWIGGVHLIGDRWRYDPETAGVQEIR